MAVTYNPSAPPLLQPIPQQPGYATAYGSTYTPGQGQAPYINPSQTYVPGQGQAPYASQGGFGTNPVSGGLLSGVNSGAGTNEAAAIAGATVGGQVDWPRVQRQLGLTSQQMDAMIAKTQQSAASNVAPAPSMNNDTVIGQGQGWMSPEQMRNATNGIQPIGSAGGGGSGSGSGDSGGSGGAAGGANDGSGAGGGLGSAGQIGTDGSTPGSLNQSSTPIGATVPYQNPGSVNNTGVVGYNNGFGGAGAGQTGVLAMQPANGQSALDQYKSTAGYQNLNAPGAYQQSPGYQYAMDQAMQGVQNGASAHGMLESGAVIKQMQQTASGLAQQDYGNWWNRQNQLYSDYQNRLQGLAGGQTGSADAMTAGANAAQGNLQTGSNLGSLFGNQGTSGMGGIINTAAAQSGNMINAGQQQASVNAANQATQLAGATIGGANTSRGLF